MLQVIYLGSFNVKKKEYDIAKSPKLHFILELPSFANKCLNARELVEIVERNEDGSLPSSAARESSVSVKENLDRKKNRNAYTRNLKIKTQSSILLSRLLPKNEEN